MENFEDWILILIWKSELNPYLEMSELKTYLRKSKLILVKEIRIDTLFKEIWIALNHPLNDI